MEFSVAIFVLLGSVGVSLAIAPLRQGQEYRYFWRRKKRIKKQEIYGNCTLCSRYQTQTERLIGGNQGAVCSQCLIDCTLMLDDEDNAGTSLGFLDTIIIEKLDSIESPLDVEPGLTQYLLNEAERSPARRQLIVQSIMKKKNFSLSNAILSNLPANEWTCLEACNWIWGQSMAGKFEEALKMPEIQPCETDAQNDYCERLYVINKMSIEIELDKRHQSIAKHLSSLLLIKQRLDSAEAPMEKDYFYALAPLVMNKIAYCYFLLGELEPAKQCLAERKVIAEHTGAEELILGDICEKRGDLAAANIHWERGLKFERRGIYRERLLEKLGL